MNLGEIASFDAGTESERMVQGCGCLLEHDRFYATVRPEGATPNDGEFRLLVRDDAFGAGILQVPLDWEWPAQMISGDMLADPVDAILLTHDGFVLFIRSGRMRVEKIPGAGNMTEVPNERGSVHAMAIISGKLHVTGQIGRHAVRHGDSDWEILQVLESPEDLAFGTIVPDGSSGIVLGGNTRYDGCLMLVRPGGDRRLEQPDIGLLTAGARDNDGLVWMAGWRSTLIRGDVGGGLARLETGVTADFSGLGIYGSDVFLSGPGNALWRWTGAELVLIRPFSDNRELLIRSFERNPAGLVAQGENGFAIYDGNRWERIEVPW